MATIDSIQQRLAEYASSLKYEDLSPQAIRDAKAHLIDTLGALIGGFFGEPCRVLRDVAAQMPNADGATIIGTRMKTTPDMAALVNGTTARYVELNDFYHRPGAHQGHPSDVMAPVLAAAEHAQMSGRDLITGIVLGYEALLRVNDQFHNLNFDNTNFCVVGSAVAAAKLLGLSQSQIAHAIAMAVVPNVILAQVRRNHRTAWKEIAAGHAGRAGVFAALLARAGMEGPHLPFEGKAGWCDHVARERFSIDDMGGGNVSFKITETRIKRRSCAVGTIPAVLAAEKLAPLNLRDVETVRVELYKWAGERFEAAADHYRNADSREAADHSLPFVVAAALLDGTVTPRTYDDAHLSNPDLRAVMRKMEVVENPEFTQAYERRPQQHRTRVTVVLKNGERLVGETGGEHGDLAAKETDGEIDQKFRTLTEDYLGGKRVSMILRRLWHLEEVENVAEIPHGFVIA